MTRDKNGFRQGNYEKLPDGRVRWRVRVAYGDGTTGRKSGTAKNERAAQKAAAEAVAAAAAVADPKQSPTISELVEQYIEDKANEWKPRTEFNNRDIYARHVLPVIGERKAGDIKPADLNRYYRELQQKGLGFSGQNQIAALLSGAYKWAIVNNLLTAVQNPTVHARPKRGERARMRQAFTAEQAAAFYREAIKDVWAWPLVFMLLTGLRIGEAVGLRWENVEELNDGRTRIRVTNTRAEHRGKVFENAPKTPESQRTLIVAPEAAEILRLRRERGKLEAQVAGEPVSPYVFSSLRRGREVSQRLQPMRQDTLRGVMTRICKLANVPVYSPHVLRHTWTSLLYRQGENIATISKGLGHAKITTTSDYYLKAFSADVDAAHIKLDLTEAGDKT